MTSNKNLKAEGKSYTDAELAEIVAKAKEEGKAEVDAEVAARVEKESEIIKARAKAEAMKELAQESDQRSIADNYVSKPGGEVISYFSKTSGRCLEFAAFDRLGKDKIGPEVLFQGHLFRTDDENLQKLIESTKDFKNRKIYLLNADVAAKLSGKSKTQYVHGAASSVTTPEAQKEPAVVK